MANELQVSFSAGKSAYFLLRNRVGQVWNTSGGTGTFENYNSSVYSSYVLSATEQGSASAFYAGSVPAAVPAGVLSVLAKQQIGGSPAEADPAIGAGDLQWNGTVTLPLSDLSTSGQVGQLSPIRVARGTMVKPFVFKMVSAVDHVTPFTSGTCSGQISRDGGAFGALQSGAFSEIGLGFFSLQALTSGDLLANAVALSFSANGVSGGAADPATFVFLTQRTSGF